MQPDQPPLPPQYPTFIHGQGFLPSDQSLHLLQQQQQQQLQQQQYIKYEPGSSSPQPMQQLEDQQFYSELERSSTVKGKVKEERHQQHQFYKLDRSSTVKGKEKAVDR